MKWLIAIIFILSACLSVVAEESPQDLLNATTSQSDLTLIDPELSNTPIPKLVLPPEPPAGLRLPELIVKADEWKGVQCGVQDSRYAVFQHADKWTSFWGKAMAPYSSKLAKVPPIDFDKDMVIGVFMGERNRPNYEMEIRSIRIEPRPEGGKVLVVRYREVTKMQGVFVPPFTIQPFHMKKVPCFEGLVVFTKVHR
jgi:hypothetical protein